MTPQNDGGPPTSEELRARMVAAMDATGRVAEAFSTVPRHRFLPERIRPLMSQEWVNRADDPDAWAELVHRDEPVVTQTDDGAPGGPGVPSSSSSMPSVMARMIEAAGIGPGMRVLEVGTGTGYNAALLGELVGSAGRVTTVEVDGALADRARGVLSDAGYTVRVVSGDGADGCPEDAPFDAVIATCAVTRVPAAWLSQNRRGGVVVTPWTPNAALPGGLMARLEVGRGWAEGLFAGGTSFMLMRSQRWGGGAGHDPRSEPEDVREVADDPRRVVLDERCGPQLAMMVPAWRWGVDWPNGTDGDHRVWLSSLDRPAWARLHANGRVEQAGQRRLWDEIETAHAWWSERGSPAITGYGLTVEGDGEHRVWLGDPDGPSWVQEVPGV
ncbi:methyltransferase domain-containing protein [Nocardiopsis sp. CT-R113]|uniref:Protein-L-isoaspartate O-methyltransferase n=1 Tax=Nocardiopsis codii TaxID=3065942 RepID=A0ABU7KGG3_9ACTN|nr:methyltransferase domain-containing protein [Nocardiopsis sp. CT-R113]MEE2041319.1 methyltransferase domain-containing protein [Nocardiopsis sp. CT-R113]